MKSKSKSTSQFNAPIGGLDFPGGDPKRTNTNAMNDENFDDTDTIELLNSLSHTEFSDEERAWLNRAPVGREIWWREEVLEAELPDYLKATLFSLNFSTVERQTRLQVRSFSRTASSKGH